MNENESQNSTTLASKLQKKRTKLLNKMLSKCKEEEEAAKS
jgi:hypothetical protein